MVKMIALISLVVVFALGFLWGSELIIPFAFTEYIAVAILAFLDSLFGGVAANIQKKYNTLIFITGFFGNAIIAIFFVYLGQKLNVDIYLAAVIIFSGRILNNFSLLRRLIIEKAEKKSKAIKSEKEK